MEEETAPDAAPEQRPEGRLLADALARQVPKMSQREASRRAGMSETRWRQIVQGYQQLQDGVRAPVTAPPETLARMAFALGVSERELAAAGRMDAAEALREMGAKDSEPYVPGRPPRSSGHGLDESLDVLIARAQMQRQIVDTASAAMARQESELSSAMFRLHEVREEYHNAVARLDQLQRLIADSQAMRARMRDAIEGSEDLD